MTIVGHGLVASMKEITSTVTSRGQVTIPAEVRRRLGIKPHAKVSFVIDDAGTVRLIAEHSSLIEALRGAAGSLKTPMSYDEMLEIAREDRVNVYLEKRGTSD